MSRVLIIVPSTVARLFTRPIPPVAARRFYASGQAHFPDVHSPTCLPRHSSSHVSNDDPDVIELEKKRNLSKQQGKTSTPHEFAPGWNEHLASVSEAYVKVLSTLPFVECPLTTVSGGQSDWYLT
jgi:hypothetical protein